MGGDKGVILHDQPSSLFLRQHSFVRALVHAIAQLPLALQSALQDLAPPVGNVFMQFPAVVCMLPSRAQLLLYVASHRWAISEFLYQLKSYASTYA